VTILIAGDLCPTSNNIELFEKSDIRSLLGDELFALWNNADFRVFNLETPITDVKTPIQKHGPNLCAPTRTMNGITALQPSLIILSNNHILDQGPQGLDNTISLLRKNNIEFIGAGSNLIEASRPYILQDKGIRVGF